MPLIPAMENYDLNIYRDASSCHYRMWENCASILSDSLLSDYPCFQHLDSRMCPIQLLQNNHDSYFGSTSGCVADIPNGKATPFVYLG